MERSSWYERGLRAGWWTLDQVRRCGFHSAQECLLRSEQDYQEEFAKLPGYPDPVFAQCQADYLEGEITATRQSLAVLMAEGL